jgi:hypothetical protein
MVFQLINKEFKQFWIGFPLEKVIEYQELHPDIFMFNDIPSQKFLLDRRVIYGLLQVSLQKVSALFLKGFDRKITLPFQDNSLEIEMAFRLIFETAYSPFII